MRWNKSGLFFLPVAALFCCAMPLLPARQESPQNAAPQFIGPQEPPSLAQQTEKAEEDLRTPFVLIDPGHGGEDKGVVFNSKLLEKDVTLALGRELRKQLEERGIPARMVRDSDLNVSLDQRAEEANGVHTAMYIALHAGRLGKGVRVYAPLLASTEPASGRFLPWGSAQMASLDRSRKLALAVAREMQKRNIRVLLLASPLRPLNNVIPPAIAVELAPDSNNVRSLASERTQASVASAIASAIAQRRARAGGRL